MSMPRIIGITGYAQAGKDTAAAVVAQYGYERLAFADNVKALARRIDPAFDCLVASAGMEAAKKVHRPLLQALGQGVREVVAKDAWIESLARNTKGFYSPDARFVISDVRYRNEAAWIKCMRGEVWRIIRIEDGKPFDNGVGINHDSEREVGEIVPDVTFFNDGTIKEFEYKVRAACAWKGAE